MQERFLFNVIDLPTVELALVEHASLDGLCLPVLEVVVLFVGVHQVGASLDGSAFGAAFNLGSGKRLVFGSIAEDTVPGPQSLVMRNLVALAIHIPEVLVGFSCSVNFALLEIVLRSVEFTGLVVETSARLVVINTLGDSHPLVLLASFAYKSLLVHLFSSKELATSVAPVHVDVTAHFASWNILVGD